MNGSDIQKAVFEGLKDEFSSEPRYKFTSPNNPIHCEIDDEFHCEIRVNVSAQFRIEIWTLEDWGTKANGKPHPLCRPHLRIPLESPDCFEQLFAYLREQ